MNFYQSNTCRKDFYDDPRAQERQPVLKQQSYIPISVTYLTYPSSSFRENWGRMKVNLYEFMKLTFNQFSMLRIRILRVVIRSSSFKIIGIILMRQQSSIKLRFDLIVRFLSLSFFWVRSNVTLKLMKLTVYAPTP